VVSPHGEEVLLQNVVPFILNEAPENHWVWFCALEFRELLLDDIEERYGFLAVDILENVTDGSQQTHSCHPSTSHGALS